MRPEIQHVVDIIRDRYAERLSLSDLSDEVRLSRFHLARIFSHETGLPPGHYLTAVRMEQARWRLLHTDEGIADISLRVGYASLGTFTTRFSQMNGVSPGRFRRLTALGDDAKVFSHGAKDDTVAYGAIVGRVSRRDGLTAEPLYIAAFPASVVSGRPARCRRIARSDVFWQLPHIPVGDWAIQVISRSNQGSGIAVAASEPVKVAPGAATTVLLALDTPRSLPLTLQIRCPQAAVKLPELFQR